MPSLPAPLPPPAERLERLVERTARLHRLTAHLSSALQIERVAEIVVDEGVMALDAASGALWQRDRETNQLVLVRALHYPEVALPSVRVIPLDPQIPIADAVLRAEPVWLSSRADYAARYPASEARTRAMSPAGYSVAALPIVSGGEAIGVIALVFLAERGFDEDERTHLRFVALHCAQGFERARLYELAQRARRDAEVAQERAQFLARASAILGSSLDFETTLQNVATIAVPTVGDWCSVDMIDDFHAIKLVAVAHVDPAKVELARELRRRYPIDWGGRRGSANVLRTGVSELFTEITDELLAASAVDAEHLRIARELGLRSGMVVAIRDAERIVGAITFVIADRERRYMQDDLVMAEQLAERAGAAITNARLYTAARDAIQARDDFMLVAGHELRTPLAAIVLNHEALTRIREGTPLDKVRERGHKLLQQSDRLTRLVEDLLDVSRITAGRLRLNREELDLGAMVREIADRMHDDFERAQTPIAVEAVAATGHWDRARIDQIITNLLTNAIKYGKGAPVEVRVTCVDEAAILVVRDHGIGIAREDQPRIFQRFERAVSPRNFAGLGLGLWIASQLVEAHGGQIGVESEPGAGATFTLSLPRAL